LNPNLSFLFSELKYSHHSQRRTRSSLNALIAGAPFSRNSVLGTVNLIAATILCGVEQVLRTIIVPLTAGFVGKLRLIVILGSKFNLLKVYFTELVFITT
jgi:hypothetical protein